MRRNASDRRGSASARGLVPADAVAGTRYPPAVLAHMDSGRRGAGRPAVAHLPPSMCLPCATCLRATVVTVAHGKERPADAVDQTKNNRG